MKVFFFTLTIFIVNSIYTQTIPSTRLTDWSSAGSNYPSNYPIINMQSIGAVGDGITSNDSIINHVLSLMIGNGAILEFSQGQFLFTRPILLPSNVILRGQGPSKTIFKHNLGGNGDAILVKGKSTSITSSINQSVLKNDTTINVSNGLLFKKGDWVQLLKNDSALVTSNWALNSVGQLLQIKQVVGNQVITNSPIRMTYLMNELPYIQKFTPIQQVGIECIKIERIDNTAPLQTSNIKFEFSVNSWVKNVESENCTFSHINLTKSSNISITDSYFHHAFDYGPNGRAYGVMIQFTSNECLVQNNVFQYLRHAMILQAGANANVFAYNYSFNPFWTSTPSNSAGDMVLHGNYPYLNLFEHNQGQNIVIDNSHGPNGPFNTFFRNRASLFGIFFSASNSPNQNIIGNEITNNRFPYSLVNYTIQGGGHFLYGNSDKGNLKPSGTSILPLKSLIYNQQPTFINNSAQWGGIGTPNLPSSNVIPAYLNYSNNNLFSQSCGTLSSAETNLLNKSESIIYPNPTSGIVHIKNAFNLKQIKLFDQFGKVILLADGEIQNSTLTIDLSSFTKGIYILHVQYYSGNSKNIKILLKD